MSEPRRPDVLAVVLQPCAIIRAYSRRYTFHRVSEPVSQLPHYEVDWRLR